jgi:hypothetical protein
MNYRQLKQPYYQEKKISIPFIDELLDELNRSKFF